MNEIDHLLYQELVNTLASTNALSLDETLGLILANHRLGNKERYLFQEFKHQLGLYQLRQRTMDSILEHPVAVALGHFFSQFPLLYSEDHTHLTGSLGASFVLPHLQEELCGQQGPQILAQVKKLYPQKISSDDPKQWANDLTEAQLTELLTLGPGEHFDRYLMLLYLPKVILTTQERHQQASFHMAQQMHRYHVGQVRLKFTLAREQGKLGETSQSLSAESVLLGLYEGFKQYQTLEPRFKFILSPSFRKEQHFFNQHHYQTKADDFNAQVQELLAILDKHPHLKEVVTEVDTVGDERHLYRKEHFHELRRGLRKLKSRGFSIRSHHGEVWTTLRRGIQAVDNAMNLWDIDTLEHGLSLGINPNSYFQRLYLNALELNQQGKAIHQTNGPWSDLAAELRDLNWNAQDLPILQQLLDGVPLNSAQEKLFTKTKFHTALDLEHYQHDVLNRLLQKRVSLVALPSSNQKLTHIVDDYLDHPFSWWEKKGIHLGLGTDNMVTLSTNYIKEMLVILFTDPYYLKIMKLLMVATGETRRPYLSHLLWKMAHQ